MVFTLLVLLLICHKVHFLHHKPVTYLVYHLPSFYVNYVPSSILVLLICHNSAIQLNSIFCLIILQCILFIFFRLITIFQLDIPIILNSYVRKRIGREEKFGAIWVFRGKILIKFIKKIFHYFWNVCIKEEVIQSRKVAFVVI
jgi:hypothetical protein